ncbi:MAG: shikimate dehydrogenase [Candidatus Solibacter sp.]|nr:shikimate dehydrogenase [Candidatus Solibacter sp.]
MRFLVGLIGSGIASSGSPAIHEREARQLGIHLHYQLVDLEPKGLSGDHLPALLDAAELMGFAGVNVTHPCKQAVIPCLHELSADAEAIGAVNTVVFRDGRRIGHNTDWSGFHESLRRGLPGACLDSVLLVGAGGGGSAVCYAVLKLGVKRLFVFDWEGARAEKLAGQFAARFDCARISAVTDPADAIRAVDGLIHATPAGMVGHPGMAIEPQFLRPDLWVADIVYFPLETELLLAARQQGCRTLDGGGMAVFQAAEAFRLFTGAEPDRERMLAQFRDALRR